MEYTIKDLSERMNVSQKTIRRHIHAKKLKATKVNNAYRISGKDAKDWEENLNEAKSEINSSKFFSNISEEKYDLKPKYASIKSMWSKNYWYDELKKPKLTFAEMFAGAGGLSTGLIMSGMKPILSVEIMEQAVKTYNRNIAQKFQKEGMVETRDIRDSQVKEYVIKYLNKNKVDVISGGFPCQGFSMAGPRVVDDPRNSLYRDMLEIVEGVMPKYVLMENVTGLRTMLNGKVEQKIIEDYRRIGYNINVATLNSADYGVPQQRKRVIFIANRVRKENLFPQPLFKKEEYVSVKDAIEEYLEMPENDSINHIFTRHKEGMSERLAAIPEGKSLYANYSDAWKKVHWDKPSPTVKENHGGVFVHPRAPRTMTPRELAKLQSFPDDFIFQGSKKWQLVQIGNAVPPLLGKALGHSLIKMNNKK